MCHIRRHDRTISIFSSVSLFFHLTAVYFILSASLLIYTLFSLTLSCASFSHESQHFFALDLFHLVHPLAYTNTFSICGHMCARVQGFVIEQDRSLETKK